jgi:hypothetical protein
MQMKTQPSWNGVDGTFGIVFFLKAASGISTTDLGFCLSSTSMDARLPCRIWQVKTHPSMGQHRQGPWRCDLSEDDVRQL